MMLLPLVLLLSLAGPAEASLLEVALSAAEWLEGTARCRGTSRGRACSWPMNSTDDAPANYPYLSTSLYYGSPGIAIFLAQAGDATSGEQQRRWQDLSRAALEDVRAGVPGAIASYGPNVGFYYGLAGLAFALRATSQSWPDAAAFAAAAAELERHIFTVAPFAESPTATLWNNTDVAHGAAGTGLALLWASRAGSEALRQGASRAGRWLLTRAEAAAGGLRWARGPDTDGEHAGAYYPTFCCGTAGVGYFLAELSLAADEPGLLEAARAAAGHVLAVASAPRPGTLLLPHGEQAPDNALYYLGWCHGPPGWARLFVKLWEVTGEEVWLQRLAQAAKAVELFVVSDLDMLFPRGARPWQNLGQCCGAAAAGSFLLQVATSDLPLPPAAKRSALLAARRIADAIAAEAAPAPKGFAFPSPEEHAAPNDRRWQAGWMQGAAGVGSFLLQLHAVESGSCRGARLPWPDEPWRPCRVAANLETEVLVV